MKVYELAKKLEVTSVFLMNKIKKEWKLPVKSHMEKLSPEILKQIEDNFLKEKSVKTKATKKTTTKKAKTTRTRSVVRKKATATKKTEDQTAVESSFTEESSDLKTSPQPKKRIIIRRKEDAKKLSATSETPKKETAETDKEDKKTVTSVSSGSKSMRLDMVSVKSGNILDNIYWGQEEEEDKTFTEEKKQPKRPIAEKDVSSKFNATDFRKREVIFQPRKKRTAQVGEFKSTQITTPKSHKRIVKVHGDMDIEELCKKIGVKKRVFIKKLKSEGVDTSQISMLDYETIALVVPAFGFTAKNTLQTEKEILKKAVDVVADEKSMTRAPVVTIMGHVDHGKTTLLDTIRKAKVAEGEAGGITQHIGAYSVFLEGRPITFIDTPGHSAFTAMRSRGAKSTDIVIILVSADDGVQPQTIEALNHAKSAETPFIIAMSKMDAPGANPDKIKKQMSEQNVVPEDWGGDIAFVPISALKKEGIKELLEQIQVLAEIQDLKYNPELPAKGVVLESRKEKGSGCVVSLLVQDGVLKLGQNLVVGEFIGRVRQMKNDQGQIVKEVLAGFPVEMIGLNELAQAGDSFCVVKNEKAARDLVALRKNQKINMLQPKSLSPEELLEKLNISSGEEKGQLNIILKSDMAGSLEALKKSLEEISSDEVDLKVVHSGMGAITESDVLLASTLSGVVFGFNVRPDSKASKSAKEKSVAIYSYSVIYQLIDQVKQLMLGLLKTDIIEEDQGKAEVRDIFHLSKVGTIAGCYVTKGKILRSSFVRVVRDGRLIHEGALSGLRRFKDDVKQVGEGFECGISLEKFNDIKPKDVLECYLKKEQARTEL